MKIFFVELASSLGKPFFFGSSVGENNKRPPPINLVAVSVFLYMKMTSLLTVSSWSCSDSNTIDERRGDFGPAVSSFPAGVSLWYVVLGELLL